MKMDRLLAIVMILSQQKKVSTKVLAEKCEVSQRTILRDVDTLAMAGLPIYSTTGRNGGISLVDHFKAEMGVFSADDMRQILSSLTGYHQLMADSSSAITLSKMQATANRAAQTSPPAIFVDLSPSAGNQELRATLAQFQKAISLHHKVSFDYLSGNGEATKREVEPYYLTFKESKWYLQAYCLMREDFRIFKITRMENIQFLSTPFSPKEAVPLSTNATDWMSPTENVLVKMSPKMKSAIIDQWGQSSILEANDDYCLVAYPAADNEAGYQSLLRFGKDCEIVSPPELRSHFKKYVELILEIYS